ncbi:hypothetical protein, partial [Aeromonas caviae]|uniref:hypothetical protein n=1 Tax=Aeromonas caviae TaxID=648 RepID=UPI002B459564
RMTTPFCGQLSGEYHLHTIYPSCFMFSAPCNAAYFAPPLVFPPGTHSPEIAPGSLPVALYI